MLRSGEILDIRELYEQGVSITEIARRTGRDRKTVRKWIKSHQLPKPRKQPRPSILDPFKEFIVAQMQKGVTNAERMLADLRKRGYTGQVRILRAFMEPYRPLVQAVATVRFETQPGHQAQVDWGDFGYITVNGKREHLYCFIMVLAYSRALYLEFTTSTDTGTFLRCHINAFRFFGGVTEEILYDNLRSVVKGRDETGRPIFNPRFEDFAGYYGFRPRACLPYQPRTKGKVERPVGYIRSNFFQGREVSDLADLNHQAAHWRDTVANVRVHATTQVQPVAHLAEEELRPLDGRADFDTSMYTGRRVANDCTIAFNGNRYSVPWRFVGRDVLVRVTPTRQLQILWQDEIVAQHAIIQGRGQAVRVPEHYKGLERGRPGRPVLELVARPAPNEVEKRPLSYYDEVAGVTSRA